MENKTCSGCNKSLPLSGFFKDSRNTGPKGKGVCAICKTCSQRKKRKWYDLNRERYKKYNDEYYKRTARKQTVQKFAKKHNTNFSLGEYELMFKLQDGVCAICRMPSTDGRSLAIDHSHTTGKIRGLLCNNCNNGLGRFKDSAELLAAAIEYLSK